MDAIVVRVSVLRCTEEAFSRFEAMMREAEAVLRPGIERMPGLIAYYAGADPHTNSLTNTSLWQSLRHAQQMDTFGPMLDLGRQFAAEGAQFERPIMNYTTLWNFGPDG